MFCELMGICIVFGWCVFEIGIICIGIDWVDDIIDFIGVI